MIINHNISALNTYRQLNANSIQTSKALEKLSSGLRINKAGDDAAGLAISEKMRAQIRGLDQASRNAQDAISMIQTAEGALNESQSILQRMRELGTQAANDTNVDQDRTEIQKEMNQLTSELNRIGNTTEFNTKKLLDGGVGRTAAVAYQETVKGAATQVPAGAVANFAVLQNSIAQGTAEVSAVSVDRASVKAAGSVIGQVSSSVTSVKDSIKGGQGTTADFSVLAHSTKAASGGALGSPATVTQGSAQTGSLVISAGGTEQAISVVNAGKDDKATYTYAIDTVALTQGSTLEIGGKSFTKAAADDAAAGEFKDAAGLVAAMNHANAFNSANTVDGYTAVVGDGNAITLTKNAAGGENLPSVQNTIKAVVTKPEVSVAVTDSENGYAAVAARYSFDSTGIDGLTNDDTVTIGGKTYTKKAADSAAAGEFKDVAGLVAALNDGTAGLGNGYTAAVGTGPDVGKVIITKGTAGVDLTAATISAAVTANISGTSTPNWKPVSVDAAGADATKAEYDFDYGDFGALADGDTVEIGGKIFTKAATTDAGTGKFADRAGLIAALNDSGAGITGYGAAADGAAGIKITKSTAGVDADFAAMGTAKTHIASASSGTYETVSGEAAEYAFELYKNATAGDTITIGGETFQAVNKAGDPVTTGNVAFVVGETEFDTAENLAKAMNDRALISTHTLKDYSVAVDATDKNLIRITGNVVRKDSTAVANDFLIGGTGTAAVTQGTGKAGVVKFEIASNFAEGQKVTIDGIEFVAGKTTDAGKNQFQVGADPAATAKNLYDLITAPANATKYAAIVDNYTLTDPSTQTLAIDKDTIVMTEKTGHYSGKTDEELLRALNLTVTDSTQQLGKAAFQITSNFVAGNTLKIGSITLTAVGEDGNNSATTFKAGKTIEETVANIKTALAADGTYTVEADGKKLTLTEKVAGGVDLASGNITTTGTAKQAGEYTFDILKNFAAGETITIDGRQFTAVTGGVKAGQFAIGTGEGDAANSLVNAINNDSVLKDKYTATVTGMTIKLTEKAGADTNYSGMKAPATPVAASPTVVEEVRGEYSFKVTGSFSEGDKLKLAGENFEAGKDFALGASSKETLDNLVAAINSNANIGTAKRFEATLLSDTSQNILEPEYSIKLIENEGMAGADDGVTAEVTQREAQTGIVKFDIGRNFSASDQLTVGEVTLSAGTANAATSFAIGQDIQETVANIKSSIEQNETLNNKYSVIVSGTTLALQEKQASGVNTATPVVTNSATKGVYEFELPTLGKESSVAIDGRELVFKQANASEAETAGQLKGLIERDVVLKDKYAVEVNGTTVKLTQKTGAESEQGPSISYTIAQGSGFSAKMQIGANTGQSMSVTVNDMRAKALGVSVVDKVEQTVEVDGKQYQVAWTENTSVTNGTDDVNVEYSLDVSNYENATAAIKVIDTAINAVSAERSKLGAFQNRLEHTINNLGTSSENLTAAESRVRDVDMAKEMMEFTKNNILSQAAQAMLAQANQQPQGVLQLLR